MYTNNNTTRTEVDECREYARSIARELDSIAIDGVNGDGEACDMYDYTGEQALDVEYLLDSKKALIGVMVYVTLGGPTCWIDSRRQEVVCHWGSASASWSITPETADAVTDAYRWAFE